MTAKQIIKEIEGKPMHYADIYIQGNFITSKEPMPDKLIIRYNVFGDKVIKAISFYNHGGKCSNVTFNWHI